MPTATLLGNFTESLRVQCFAGFSCTVNHKILRGTLRKKGIHGKLLDAVMSKYSFRQARIKSTGEGGKVERGKFWDEIEVGTTQGGVDSMQLFCALTDDLECELATAGVRGVQFMVNQENQQVRNKKMCG